MRGRALAQTDRTSGCESGGMVATPNAPAGRARVGISGWRYASWRGDFYPKGLVQRRELEYVGERMSSVELNGSFYSLQRRASYERWRDAVPEGFVFAVKGPRFITHMLRLRNAENAMANFFASGVLALGAKLGPILWQLPERQELDVELLEAFFAGLPRSTAEALELARRHDERMVGRAWLEGVTDAPLRHVLEPRARSFETAEAVELLRRHDVALAVADTAGRWPAFGEVTSDFVYIRLHGSRELYASGYTPEELDGWAERIRGWTSGSATPDGRPRDVYAYFDNDIHGHAPHDAVALASRVERRPGSG